MAIRYILIALIILGVYFGYAAYISNSIFIPITLHFLNNFIAIIAYFILGSEDILEAEILGIERLETHVLSLLILSIIFYGFIVFIKNYYHKFKSN